MQNPTDSRIPCFSTPQPNMDVPLNGIAIKVHKYTKYVYKSEEFLQICEIEVINYRNQNMAVLLNVLITSTI